MSNVLVDRLQEPEFVDRVLEAGSDGRVPGSIVLDAYEANLPDRLWDHPAVVSSYFDLDDLETWTVQRGALPRAPVNGDWLDPDHILTRVVPIVRASRVAFVPDDLRERNELQLFAFLGDTRGRLTLIQRRGRWATPTFDTSLHCSVGRCEDDSDCTCGACCELCKCTLIDEIGFDAMTCLCPVH